MTDEQCTRCGHENAIWVAHSPLWNAVMRGGCINGGRCPECGEDEMDGSRCYYCGFHDYNCGICDKCAVHDSECAQPSAGDQQ